VALFSHVDSASDFLGDGVAPVVHRNYSGEVIAFAKGPEGIVLDPAMCPVLASKAGDTIITPAEIHCWARMTSPVWRSWWHSPSYC